VRLIISEQLLRVFSACQIEGPTSFIFGGQRRLHQIIVSDNIALGNFLPNQHTVQRQPAFRGRVIPASTSVLADQLKLES
jgi:hypothetical protein